MERLEAKAEAEKQAAILEKGRRLAQLVLEGDTAGVEELIANNTFVEVYNAMAAEVRRL